MATIDVDGMSCTGCEDNVTDALGELPGVESTSADHEAGTATVEGDVDIDAVVAAVEDAGYEASA